MSADRKRSGEDLEDSRDPKKQKLFSSDSDDKISQQKKLQNAFFQKALAEVSGTKNKIVIGSKPSPAPISQKTSDRPSSERTSRDDKKDRDRDYKDHDRGKNKYDRRDDRRRDEDRRSRDDDRDRSRHRDKDDRRDYRRDDKDRRDDRSNRDRDNDRSRDDKHKDQSKKSRDSSPDPAESRREELQRLQIQQLEKAQRRLEKIEKSSSKDDEKHWKDKSLKEMTTRDWRIFREDHNITTKGGSIPNPIRNWEESELPSWLLKGVADLKFKAPSPIQMQAIPAGLQKRDLMGTAETGSGKTAAFSLPILVHVSKLPQTTGDDGPYAVIMAPTRELAVQIEDKIIDFAKYAPTTIRTACLIGGDPIDTQAFHLSKGVEIVVGTPGRINECIEKQMLILTSCHFVVLDEADVMIDMNFEPQILSVLDAIPANRNRKKREDGTPIEPEVQSDYELITVMFSATMPPSIERLARSYLRKPAYVHIGEIGVVVDRITQRVLFCKNDAEKRRKLEELVTETQPPVIVFVNQKATCESIMKFLTGAGHKATSLHSNKNLDSRLYSLDSFKEGQFQILVATDVARRGLDVPNVQHVINYEMPQKITDYTHRIGRTGRAGQKGLATSLVTNEDSHILYDLKQALVKSNNTVPPELRDHPAAQFKADGGAKMKDIV